MGEHSLMTIGIAIQAHEVCKSYQVYKTPMDRLYQAFWRGKKTFYAEFRALDRISFHVKKNETVGIIGSNGSGKSTLLRMMCGILAPSSGELVIDGRVTALLELGTGFNPEFTGRENVFMNAAIMGLTTKETHRRFGEIESFADIGRFMDQPVKTYSSGMYIRLAFSVAVHVFPEILLIDEALSVGDIRFQQKCMNKIKSFCESGTVVFVSHSMAAVSELCSRVIWIENGRLRLEGRPKPVINQYVKYMYEGDTSKSRWVRAQKERMAATDSHRNLEGFSALPDHQEVFGDRRVTIDRIRLRSGGAANGIANSGQPFEIAMVLTVHRPIDRPIAGFIVKDRFGREVFGDNTELMAVPLKGLRQRGQYILFFRLKSWPNIIAGQYTLSLAIADGHGNECVPCHWYQDVAAIESVPMRSPAGIFSLLDTEVDLVDMANQPAVSGDAYSDAN